MDEIIAAEIGRMRLTILKQAHAIESMKAAIDARDREIAALKAIEPELPLGQTHGGNGHARAQ